MTKCRTYSASVAFLIRETQKKASDRIGDARPLISRPTYHQYKRLCLLQYAIYYNNNYYQIPSSYYRTRSSSQSSMSSTASISSSCGKRSRRGSSKGASKIRPSRKRLRKEATREATMASASSTNVYFLALFLLLLGLFALKTWNRNHDWNSRKTIFRQVKTDQSNLYAMVSNVIQGVPIENYQNGCSTATVRF